MANFLKKTSTEKNKTEEMVRATLLNNISEGLVAADENGDVIYCNDLAKEIMEQGLFGPIDIVSKNAKSFEYKGHQYEARYQRIPEKVGVKGIVATLVDTFGQARQAEEIEKLKNEVSRTKSFKSAFLANMSHEIRTPIHAIIGFAELLNKESIPENAKNQIDMIKDSSYSLLAIINDVLDLTKIESGKMELVCSNYYISYVIRDLEATYSLFAARKGLKFELHLDNNIPSSMYGDKIRIRGTLINILNNAIKFTKEGRVDFYIHVLEKRDGVVKLQFVVKDTGIGIKKEDIDRIFESFSKFDINNNYAVEGRGLGLSIAKGYMDLMGGTIDVKSEYGVGSTFTVTVNQKIIDDSPVDMDIINARKRRNDEKLYVKNTKVLVVDDNTVNLSVADGLMKAYGLTAYKASSGQEAIKLCMENRFDIIFMDQMMPEMDGVMTMKQIRKISEFYESRCKIIVLTADAMVGVKDRLMKEGFDEYLCKPLEIHRLEMVLRKFVDSDNISKVKVDVDNIVIEESKAQVIPEKEPIGDIERLCNNLGIDKETLERKIRDCGGTLEEYIEICKIADKHADSRVEKLRESFSTGNFDRYAIEVHSLKSSMASLGAMELSRKAKEQELACQEKRYSYIEENVEQFIEEYTEFIGKVRKYVLNEEPADNQKEEEWTREEIAKVCKRFVALVEEFNFGAVFDVLDEVKQMDMGPETKQIFFEFESIMNEMNIDRFNDKLREFL